MILAVIVGQTNGASTPEIHSLTISFTALITGLSTLSLYALHRLHFRRFGIDRALFESTKKH